MEALDCVKESKNIFKTEAEAKQALALAQLSWIVPEINKDYPFDKNSIGRVEIAWDVDGQKIDFKSCSFGSYVWNAIMLNSIDAAEILIKQHEQLLKDALMID